MPGPGSVRSTDACLPGAQAHRDPEPENPQVLLPADGSEHSHQPTADSRMPCFEAIQHLKAWAYTQLANKPYEDLA